MSKTLQKPKGREYFSLSDSAIGILYSIILISGLSLRFYFYLSNRDLGADEAHLALNFIHYGYIGLTHPLENFQSAPIFFLWSVETITRLFGFSELALRLVPFVISILSFPFFYFFVRDLTKNKIVALLAFLLFALNGSFLYFATELKPYTIDVSSFILIGFLLFSDWGFVAKRRNLLLALTGGLLLLFSISTIIILLCASIFMVKEWYFLQKKPITSPSKAYFKDNGYVWAVWGVVFIVNYFIFIYKHPYAEGMKNIWSWAFCPRNIFSVEFRSFISNRAEDTLFSNLLLFNKDYYFNYFLLLIFFAAIASMFIRKRYNILLFTLFPIFVHLVLSMLQLYPFYQRFILYLLPPMILIFSYGLYVIIEHIAKKSHWLFAIPFICFFVFATNINSIKHYSMASKARAIKPVLDYIDTYYPNAPLLIVTPFTLYYYYSETGRVKNKNFKPIDWELKPDEFYTHKLVLPMTQNYLLFYSIGDNCDGFGETLDDLKRKGLVVRQFNHSIFGVTELRPSLFKGQGKLVQQIDYQSFKEIHPSVQGSKFFIPLWSNNSLSYPSTFEKGKYSLILTARGDAAMGVFPHLNISINQKLIGELNLKETVAKYTLFFETDTLINGQLSISMDNDTIVNEEDRNAFIENIFIIEHNK
jgi:hypothetical protein